METILVEVADGLLFSETARLVDSPRFRRLVDGLVYAAADAMGALAGADWLRRRGLPLLAISGAVTASPVAMNEVAAETDLPVLTTGDLVAGRCPLLSG